MSSAELRASGSRKAAVKSAKPVRRKTVAGKRRTQAERSDEMRTRVIEAAADEVSRVAKVSRGAQQYHFPSKDSLVLATSAHLLREGLERGQARALAARTAADPIEAIIQDCMDFFLGRDFSVILDLVLASTKDRSLRDKVYGYTRESRVGVEAAWLDVLCERGVPPAKAEKVLWLTISIVRGFSVRALWQRDDERFRELLDEWKLILAGHLKSIDGARA